MEVPALDQVFAFDRAFTREEVDLFTRLSGDVGRHHVEPDAEGRVMVQGLLTAMLPTRIGGEANYIARDMHFNFLLPVFSGDALHTEAMVTERVEKERAWHLRFEFFCRNQDGKTVLTGYTTGVIRK
jgi:3-hydroxybutyryl-CoA dehydratase